MFCPHCNFKNVEGLSECQGCGKWLAVRPQSAPLDLLQLSKEEFLRELGNGIPLIVENMRKLWSEAAEIGNLGKRRAVGILQALAEEEAAKALILFDSRSLP